MSEATTKGKLFPLVTRLTACPSNDNRITAESVDEQWDAYLPPTAKPGRSITPGKMAVVLLEWPSLFGSLLTPQDRMALVEIIQRANRRFVELTTPNNKVGQLIKETAGNFSQI